MTDNKPPDVKIRTYSELIEDLEYINAEVKRHNDALSNLYTQRWIVIKLMNDALVKMGKPKTTEK